jgi:chorismate mutase
MIQEVLHLKVRRYTSPEEQAFFPDRLPSGPVKSLPKLDYPEILSPEAEEINFNQILLQKYIDTVVPSLATPGDDEQHGSCTLSDIAALQALSRRVHYGKFVAESKYRADPESYQKLVDANDAEGVMALLTNMPVEKLVLRRARLKAATYGREPLLMASLQMEDIASETTSIVAAAAASAVVAAVEAMDGGNKHGKVDPVAIESVYRDIIIPITKDIEVAYLFRRCGKQPPPEYASDRMSIEAKANGAIV